jgi:arsenate reductase
LRSVGQYPSPDASSRYRGRKWIRVAFGRPVLVLKRYAALRFAGRGTSMATVIYGITNCDTMKKARAWLDGHGHAYRFHDYRADGLDEATLDRWIGRIGWEKLLNRSSLTFRALPETDRTGLDAGKAAALMLRQPTMIKRPVLDRNGDLTVGFKPDIYERALAG